ncbi:MAG: 6-carboxytetrahydropterin synthase [Firmicutes bacterium]|nr:6-carboxytetrahydropterin synthase [Bacillota bacterium]
MYELKKRITISAAHSLKLSYKSKCAFVHGHNWVIDVFLRSEKLNQDGMIVDFDHIEEKLIKLLDHKLLNDVVPFNPTAENLAKFVFEQFAPFSYRVDVQESEGSVASYYV